MSQLNSYIINNTLINIFNEILDFLEKKVLELSKLNFIESSKEKFIFSINSSLLDDDNKFYKILFILYNEIIDEGTYLMNILALYDGEFQQKLLCIYIEYLKRILNDNQNAYKNYLIKIDIHIIFSFLRNKTDEELFKSKDFYFLNINELQKIYYDEKILGYISDVILKEYFQFKFISLREIAITQLPKDFQLNEEILNNKQLLMKGFKDNQININNITDYLEKCKNYIEIQLRNKSTKVGICYNDKIKKFLFELKDLNEIVALIENCSKTPIREIIIFLKENNFILVNDFRGIINTIIKTEEFYYKFKNILDSKIIETYFTTKITSKKKSYINYKKSYEEFKNKIFDDKIFFENLFIIKDFPKGKRALVNQIGKIFINPLFIQVINKVDKNSNKEKEQFNEIMVAYLILIIIYEIINLLKFIGSNQEKKEYNSFSQLPIISKAYEEGKSFIYYLFKISTINKINYKQTKNLLDIDNWNNIIKLNEIFIEEEDSNINSNLLSLKFYLLNEDTNSNSWIDIN